jgi:hypothetical protein
MRAIFALTFLLMVLLLITGHAFTQDQDAAAIKVAVEKSISLLESSGKTFIEKSGCISCHHQSLPAMAAALTRDRGFKINDQIAREQSEATLKEFASAREKMLQGIPPTNGGVLSLSAGYALVGLGALRQPPDKTTDAMVHYIAGTQTKDGHWRASGGRPPVDHGDFMATALTLRAIQLYAPKGRAEEMANISKGRARGSLQQNQQPIRIKYLNSLDWDGLTPATRRSRRLSSSCLASSARTEAGHNFLLWRATPMRQGRRWWL